MAIQLNHTIVWCRDPQRSAGFLTHILGLPPARRFGPFLVVEVDNRVSLDFHEIDEPISSQHYAFLIGDDDFDAVYRRIIDAGLPHWADPGRSVAGINHNDGGSGVYFPDPDDHLLEVITRPYTMD